MLNCLSRPFVVSLVPSTKLITTRVNLTFRFYATTTLQGNFSPVNSGSRRFFNISSTMSKPKHYERLPTSVIPSLYKLQLQPDLEKFTFSGKEDIEVNVKETTNQMIVNSIEIDIQSASFIDQYGGQFQGKVTFDTVDEKAFIKFDKDLKVGNGVLSLTFTGILNDKMKGFYRTKYIAPNGEERYAATTQFEPVDARRAFPCWDEPAIKAIFEVTMIAPKDRTVLSNTNPVKESQHPDNPNLKIVQFAPSPIMSTYLLAFIVGEYDYIETNTKRDTMVRVYTPLGKKDQGAFALEVASKSLNLFEDYFDIPLPLKKLDHIGIPDFASGAMENWGLVTYREVLVLADSANTSTSILPKIATTIAHETAHQWFGNLVTMDWWTNLWLNEGFASFMMYLAVDRIFPEYNIWPQMVFEMVHPAFVLDSYRNSHPIEIEVNHPEEIDAIFDAISYNKGSAVIRMCYNWIGDEAFRKGLTNYLNKHAYGNAVTKDLWDAWEASSNKPVAKTMSTWTKQIGYPVVKVEARQDGNNRVLKLEQNKFSSDGNLTEEEKQMTWMIPVEVITSKDPNKVAISTILSNRSMELVLPNVSATDWVKLNPNVMGFYRVSYSPEMLNNLKSAISSKQLGAVDRLSIISDLLALSLSGQSETSYLLSLLDSYADEDNYSTWAGIDECFGKLGLLLSYTDLTEKFNSFGIKVYKKIFDKLGFDCKDGDTHTDKLLRGLVLNRLVKFKYEPVIKESQIRFKGHFSGKPIDPDLRNVVYRAVASCCDSTAFELFFKAYREADSNEEKERFLTSMGFTDDLERIKRVLKFALSSEVRSQDAWRCIIFTTSTRVGHKEAWRFYKENADEFQKRYGSHTAQTNMISALVSPFASDEAYKDVEDFFAKKPFFGAESYINRGLESIRANSRWLERDVKGCQDFLQS